MSLVNLYRDLTLVQINNGFLLDSWSGENPLSIQFSALFSHMKNPNVSVVYAYSDIGWQLRFRHLTSLRGEEELAQLLNQITG
jgi:hypothetical protein